MAKREPMTEVERAVNRKRKLVKTWKEMQAAQKELADLKCLMLQKKIDRETVLIQALERGELKP